MKIASWNINGIKARQPNLIKWLKEAAPDVLCLQEIKSQTELFPAAPFEELGYNVAVLGQKSFNGVGIFSKHPIEDITYGLPGDDDDEQARYIEAVIVAGESAVRVASIYLPNGNPVDTDKYPYKLNWMDRLHAHAEKLLNYEEPLILAGDYNIIPSNKDVYNPDHWLEDALFLPASREKFYALENLGLIEAFRALNKTGHIYTFWDYQRGSWQKDHGIRIDHFLCSPEAMDMVKRCQIDKHTRGWEKPSDHVPIRVELAM